jgi:hypothetical protein
MERKTNIQETMSKEKKKKDGVQPRTRCLFIHEDGEGWKVKREAKYYRTRGGK